MLHLTIINGTVLQEPQFEVGSTFVGVTLSVLPEITQDNFIILKIKQLSLIVKVKNNKKILLGELI